MRLDFGSSAAAMFGQSSGDLEVGAASLLARLGGGADPPLGFVSSGPAASVGTDPASEAFADADA